MFRSLCMLFGCLGLVSCGHVFTKSKGYTQSSSALVNEAKVNASFKPNGGKGGFSASAMIYMAGSAKLEGPFLWRVQAEGKDGLHQSIQVHRVKVMTTTTKRQEWFPVEYLGKTSKFKTYSKTPGQSYAQFQMPGELKVKSDIDGGVDLLVDLTVTTSKQSQRKVVSFSMKPSNTKDVEFIFLPTEIAKGLNKDPREWKLQARPLNTGRQNYETSRY